MHTILEKLTGGDRRSIGRADEVVAQVLEDGALFEPLFQGLFVEDELVRMRAADALEKISARRPEWLQPYTEMLLYQVASQGQQEVRWHVAQLIPRLRLDARERQFAVALLFDYLEDDSKIVKTNAMQALAELAAGDGRLRQKVIPVLEQLTATGSPAMRARGRKLLAELGAQD